MDYTNKRSLNLEFNSPEDVGKYNITLVGAGSITEKGLYANYTSSINGTAPLSGEEYFSEKLTIVLKLTPHFDATGLDWDGTTLSRYMLDTSGAGSDRNLILMATNKLGFRMFGSNAIYSATTGWQQYWKEGEENTIIYSGESGDNNLWLNGHQIITAEATAWTPSIMTVQSIGVSNVNTSEATGYINSIEIFHELWSVEDVEAYLDNKLGSSSNDNELWFDSASTYINEKSKNGFDITTVGTPDYLTATGGHRLADGEYFSLDDSATLLNFLSNTGVGTVAVAYRIEDYNVDDVVAFMGNNTLTTRDKGFCLLYDNRINQSSPYRMRFFGTLGINGNDVFDEKVDDYVSEKDNNKWKFLAFSINATKSLFFLSNLDGGNEKIKETTRAVGTLSTGANSANVEVGSTAISGYRGNLDLKKAAIFPTFKSRNELRHLRSIMNNQ